MNSILRLQKMRKVRQQGQFLKITEEDSGIISLIIIRIEITAIIIRDQGDFNKEILVLETGEDLILEDKRHKVSIT